MKKLILKFNNININKNIYNQNYTIKKIIIQNDIKYKSFSNFDIQKKL